MIEPIDKGADRETRGARPCGKRGKAIGAQGLEVAFCQRPDGHDGMCNGVFSAEPPPSDFGPRAATRRRCP